MLVNVLWVGIGGFLGAICRYMGNLAALKIGFVPYFPLGTLLVNLTGCLLIGFLGYFSDSREVLSHSARLFIFTGFLGAFTTFSSFGHETVNLLRGQMPWAALANVVLHIIMGLLFVWLGLAAGRLVFR